MQSQTPFTHFENGSVARHCKSVTQGNPRLTPSPSSNLFLIPVVSEIIGVDEETASNIGEAVGSSDVVLIVDNLVVVSIGCEVFSSTVELAGVDEETNCVVIGGI